MQYLFVLQLQIEYIYIANALGLRLPCTNPSICVCWAETMYMWLLDIAKWHRSDVMINIAI